MRCAATAAVEGRYSRAVTSKRTAVLDALVEHATVASFRQQLVELRTWHARKPSLLERLDLVGPDG
jgi:hypothetical protein